MCARLSVVHLYFVVETSYSSLPSTGSASILVRFDAKGQSLGSDGRWRPTVGDPDAWTLRASASASQVSVSGREGIRLGPSTILGTVQDMPRSLFGCHVFVVATMHHDKFGTGKRTLLAQRGGKGGIMLRLEGNTMCTWCRSTDGKWRMHPFTTPVIPDIAYVWGFGYFFSPINGVAFFCSELMSTREGTKIMTTPLIMQHHGQ